MNETDRQWHISHLTGARLRVLAVLCVWRQSFDDQVGSGGATVAELASATGRSTSTVRDAVDRALRLGWVIAVGDGTAAVAGPGRRAARYAVTPAGRTEIARLSAAEVANDKTVELPVITNDDKPSSTVMTAPRRDRRGKPDWCTPGHGACRDCRHREN